MINSILLAAALLLLCTLAPASSRKPVDGQAVTDLYREGRYREVVDLFGTSRAPDRDYRLLLALSLAELEQYDQAIAELAGMYDRSPDDRYFFAYVIARIYERTEEPAQALRWYRRALRQLHGDEPFSYDREMILLAVFNRLSIMGTQQPAGVRLLRRSGSFHRAAKVYLGFLSQASRQREDAALSYYTLLIDDPGERYTRAVLRRIAADPGVVDHLVLIGLEESSLLELYYRNGFYREAVSLSYRMRPVERVLDLRARSFFNLGEFGAAIRTWEDLYRMSGGAAVSLRIAESYLLAGERRLAEQYLDRYLELLGEETPAPQAAFMRIHLDLHDADLDTLLDRVRRFTGRHGSYHGVGPLVHRLFYMALSRGHQEEGIDFLLDTHTAITDPVFQTWAFYILGIYRDRSFLDRAIDLRAGTYYHVRAVEAAKADKTMALKTPNTRNPGSNRSGSGNTRRDLVSSPENGPIAGAVLWLSSLFSGKAGQHLPAGVGSPGSVPLSREEEMLRTVEDVYQGWLYRCVELGAAALTEEVVQSTYELGGWEFQVKGHILLSHAAYARGDMAGGMTHAEIMGKMLDRRYHLFLPREVLALLYPEMYTDLIERSISKHYYHLNPYLVMAIIREESRYNLRARSLRGATGLMQLMPATAEWITGRDLTVRDLYDPSVNIEAGVRYLEYLFTRFHTLEEVLAAYNGGPTNVQRWRAETQELRIERFIEEIPFPETRTYVKKVYTTYCIYQALYR